MSYILDALRRAQAERGAGAFEEGVAVGRLAQRLRRHRAQLAWRDAGQPRLEPRQAGQAALRGASRADKASSTFAATPAAAASACTGCWAPYTSAHMPGRRNSNWGNIIRNRGILLYISIFHNRSNQ